MAVNPIHRNVNIQLRSSTCMFFCGVTGVQDSVIQKIVPALGSEAEFRMGNSFIFCLRNMEFFFTVLRNDEEFFSKTVTSNMEFLDSTI